MKQLHDAGRALAVAVAATLALGACGDRRTGAGGNDQNDPAIAQPGQRGDRPRDNAAQPAPDVADAFLRDAIKAELANERLGGLNVEVRATNGRVVLVGAAPDAATRERVAQVASSVKGVAAVDNQIRIAAP